MRTSFVITSMPVGGAETLLVNLLRRLDRTQFEPEIICLKEPGPLGEEISKEFPLRANMLRSKLDLRILPRLYFHFRKSRSQAVVTVGAGDKMFWGRLAAYVARVPVIASALHSTGWPDGVGRMNRWLTPITDAFIGVAKTHGQFLTEFEKFPSSKVVVIPNGIDTQRFVPDLSARDSVRMELGIPKDSPVIGIVAALRPEKNHELFVDMASRVIQAEPNTHFLIVGDGPCRSAIEERIRSQSLENRIHLLGVRADTPKLLAAMDAFTLTSHNEANPVSILEALSVSIPVVATDVGSVSETVRHGETGFLVKAGDVDQFSKSVLELIQNRKLAAKMGASGREIVLREGSLDAMVSGYERLLLRIHEEKMRRGGWWMGRAAKTSTSPTCQWKATPPSF